MWQLFHIVNLCVWECAGLLITVLAVLTVIDMMVSFKIITEGGSGATHRPKGFIYIILLSYLWGQYY